MLHAVLRILHLVTKMAMTSDAPEARAEEAEHLHHAGWPRHQQHRGRRRHFIVVREVLALVAEAQLPVVQHIASSDLHSTI